MWKLSPITSDKITKNRKAKISYFVAFVLYKSMSDEREHKFINTLFIWHTDEIHIFEKWLSFSIIKRSSPCFKNTTLLALLMDDVILFFLFFLRKKAWSCIILIFVFFSRCGITAANINYIIKSSEQSF